MARTILTMSGIAKSFGAVQALEGVSIEVRAGEIRGLVGENGAGKSTLMKILSGAVAADAGEVVVDGAGMKGAPPAAFIAAGVAVIYQEFSQAPHLSVAENICLGRLPTTRLGGVDVRAMRAIARAALDKLGHPLDVAARVATLSVAERQIVEIARAVAREAKIIVLDEPSAVLGQAEIDVLFALMRRLSREKGTAFVYVSHRLEEVFSICDAVTILRDGRLVETGPMSGFTREKLIERMVGRELAALYPPRDGRTFGDVALDARGISRDGVLRDVSLTVRRGEIVGLCGLSGAGRSEILHALAGADRPDRGEVWIDGAPATPGSPREAIARGVGLVPEDRKTQGLCLGRSVGFNVVLSALGRISRLGVVSRRTERAEVAHTIVRLRVKTAGPAARIGDLSGGNQQKCLIGRQIVAGSRILLIDEPTRGVDVGARREIYDLLVGLARTEGLAILMVSSELPEVLGLCDRIYVVREGRVAAELDGATATEQAVMAAAAM